MKRSSCAYQRIHINAAIFEHGGAGTISAKANPSLLRIIRHILLKHLAMPKNWLPRD